MSPALRRVAGQLALYLGVAGVTVGAWTLLLRVCAWAVK